MFSRSQRIGSVLFEEVLKKGVPFRSAHFSIALLKGETKSGVAGKGPKIAVIVPKKVAGKATLRNRLRRQARAWIKEYSRKSFPTKVLTMVVFVNTTWPGPFPVAAQAELTTLLSAALKGV